MTTPQLGDRALFPDLAARVYLNHAAVSPPSTRVVAAARAALDDYAAHGLAAVWPWIAQRTRLKHKLARLLGCAATDLAFVQSTTRGLMDLALCLPWQASDRIILVSGEFPANVTPWLRAADTFGLQPVFVPPGDLDALDRALAPGARLVAVSAVQFQTGLRMPLAAIAARAHAAGAELAVDVIQAAGVVPLDLWAHGVDYAAGGAHKWLMGLEGIGYVAIAPHRVGELVPRVAGWLSSVDPLAFLLEGAGRLRYDRPIRAEADFLELGSMNVVGAAALEAAVDTLLDLGVEAIHAHVQGLIDALERGLVDRGFTSVRSDHPDGRSGILAVRPPSHRDSVVLAGALCAAGIAVSAPDGLLRFSPHWPNHLGEVATVLDAIDDVAAVT